MKIAKKKEIGIAEKEKGRKGRKRIRLSPYPVPLYRGFLRALRFLSVAVHLHRFAHLFLIDRLRLESEHRRISHEHLHRPGTSLRAVRVIRRAGIPALVILIDSCKKQGAIVHHNDILRLIRFEQSFVLRPRHVLKGGIRFYVTMYHASQPKRQILHRGSERHFCRICKFHQLLLLLLYFTLFSSLIYTCYASNATHIPRLGKRWRFADHRCRSSLRKGIGLNRRRSRD